MNEMVELPLEQGFERRVEAITEFRQLIKTRPTDVVARVGLVVALLHNSRRAEAEAQVHALINLRNGVPDVDLNVANALLMFGRIDDAVEIVSQHAEKLHGEDFRDLRDRFTSIALQAGKVDLVRILRDVGGTPLSLASVALEALDRGGITALWDQHQAIVLGAFGPHLCHAQVYLDDHEVPVRLVTEYGLALEFAARRALEKDVRLRLADLYERAGMPRAAYAKSVVIWTVEMPTEAGQRAA